MIVKLSDLWLRRALAEGDYCQNLAEANHMRPYGNHAAGNDYWRANHRMGCVSQVAVAKLLRVPYRFHDDVYAVDVGKLVEVRARRVPGSGTDLAMRPDDRDDRPYVHTLVDCNQWVTDIIGWLMGDEAKRRGAHEGMWDKVHLCWYVPPPYRSVAELVDLYGARD